MIVVPPEIWIKVMEGVINGFLIPKFVSLGMNASGEWINSLEGRYQNNRGEIWGRDYTYYLANGRAPGNRPPITPLISWVGHKFGISGGQARSAAFAIANKIAKEGTDYYPAGTDLLEVLNSPETINYVYRSLAVEVAPIAQQEIVRTMKKVFENA